MCCTAHAEEEAAVEAAAAQPGSSEALDAEEARSNWQALKEELAEQVMHVRTRGNASPNLFRP